ncbi:hypothetical protein Hsw_0725 [Hymenobacter swuensis DY53]|uniref:Uncharacterized protein n=1 Tax=Hymenobacter swuensis DY53 TaxID=1227739 RepID=W8F3D7_9BACT|nr:hypothetical protein Hsw_0725 [Hymenobacter swuensis DY53]
MAGSWFADCPNTLWQQHPNELTGAGILFPFSLSPFSCHSRLKFSPAMRLTS